MPDLSHSSRRDFLHHLALAWFAWNLGPFRNPSGKVGPTVAADDLRALFTDPPAAARPFFRWWWNGNYVEEEELLRELRLMAAAGAGGVEVNPIELHETIPPPPREALEWLSPRWNRLLEVVARECENLGLECDLIVGTGWPFGGEFLPAGETIQGLVLQKKELEGPGRRTVELELDPEQEEWLTARLLARSVGDPGSGKELPLPDKQAAGLAVEVPAGEHVLYLVKRRHTFREVMHGAPGGAGPVLDHFNRAAVERYLNRITDTLKKDWGRSPGELLRAMFCDSIELEGANWTGDLPEQFRERRGYELSPWLPLLLDPEAPVAEPLAAELRRVRYDFSRTLAELFEERFVRPFHEWCHRHGMLSRYQAYGYPWLYTDLVDGNLIPDIPEGDQWLYNPGWVKSRVIDDIRYAIWNKYASSGGHLAGRRIISSEAMTNTSGIFAASLAYIKQATDLNLVGGVNHLVLHGYNYSPPEAGFPGWVRFGTWFNDRNPWWPYFPDWAAYTARLSALFQAAEAVSQIAILGPTADVWQRHGLDRNPFNTTPWYLHALWQTLNHHGFTSDYVNGRILEQAMLSDGRIVCGPMRYQAVLVVENETMPASTAEALHRLAEGGARILFVGRAPDRSPGRHPGPTADEQVKKQIDGLLRRFPDRAQVVDPPDAAEDLLPWGERLLATAPLEPDVRLSPPDERLFFIRYRRGDRQIYFFANTDRDRRIDCTGTFPTGELTPWRWDPETGGRSVFPFGETPFRLDLRLEPLESLLLVFDPETGTPAPAPPAPAARIEAFQPESSWQLRARPMEGEEIALQLDNLTDFRELPRLLHFGGTAVYTGRFDAPRPDRFTVLDLGKVHETSEVRLNGRALGRRWYGRHRYVLPPGLLRPRSNELEVTVTTLLFNYVKGMAPTPQLEFWLGRHRLKELQPAGWEGPLRLE